ncbi:MAG: prolyl oligopeptidase family serine peptidase [Exilibacterium sp.]
MDYPTKTTAANTFKIGFLLVVAFCALAACIHELPLKEIHYPSAADNTFQPAMFYAPATPGPKPLIMALHTWSGDYKQTYHNDIAEWAVKNNWAYMHPNFRGNNNRPEATGSDLVVADILSAVEYAKQNAQISSVYLVGTSGGGYTALIMAGRHPEVWDGVSVWVPIADLEAWYHYSEEYRKDIVKSCGGAPGDSPAVDAEYRQRSPVTWLVNAREVPLHINAGIHDETVPPSHSIKAFNTLALPQDRLDENWLEPLQVISGNDSLTLFDGGHDLIAESALEWFQALAGMRPQG